MKEKEIESEFRVLKVLEDIFHWHKTSERGSGE